jgi:hypothetical protein
MFYRQYYSELGKVLYAIANANGNISDKERDTLKNIVRKELVPAEQHKDTFGTDAAYYAEIEFDILEDSLPDTEAAFESFTDFIAQHHTAITPAMRESALRVTNQLIQTYHHHHKKEHALAQKLNEALKSLPAHLPGKQ